MPKSTPSESNAEKCRLAEDSRRERNWKRWGPYLSDRQWGTVREDYSEEGNPWTYFTHEQAGSRAYRWGEDGLLGWADRQCRLCFSPALWNTRDPILKERLFGLTGPEGNHGEDVKELYFHLDGLPTHAYARALYKYPQARFPYESLREHNRKRGLDETEFELSDTGVFDDSRYFDLDVEYAKAGPDDTLIRLTVHNRGPEPAPLHLLGTIWFRNTWSWGRADEAGSDRPEVCFAADHEVVCRQETLGEFRFAADPGNPGWREWLFTDNETNARRLFGAEDSEGYWKDAFHDRVIEGNTVAVRGDRRGTKAAAWSAVSIDAGQSAVFRFRLFSANAAPKAAFGPAFEEVFETRIRETDAFYGKLISASCSNEERRVARRAYAGLLWTKQFYHYVVKDWLEGDPSQPPPPEARARGRNSDWPHLFNRDVISMPDKWEYPWYAAWDVAFHMIPFARIDPEFAKQQLNLFLREWYMHPNGQIPAYEFALSDVNPPVHAWACWRVYKMTGERGSRDRLFLARTFQKLLVNFTWWVNRKDPSGRHLFAGGFLGLDNIGVFDRSKPLPAGGHLEQADGTAWMAFYCATMLAMALELAEEDPEYEDIASKFFEHFVHIADAINTLGGTGLWDEEDGFYYDQILINGDRRRVRLRSMVGLVPLFAVEIIERHCMEKFPGFAKRTRWFLKHRADLASRISYLEDSHGAGGARYLLAIPTRTQLERVLTYLMDEREFLSPFGVRSLSGAYRDKPYVLEINGERYEVAYTPGESDTGLFGGNSNWRGPVWFPVNYLLVEALERYHHFYGDAVRVEYPRGSGKTINLREAAREIERRLVRLFLPNGNGRRPIHGLDHRWADDPHWRDHVLFHEYFHAETGKGLGASHQTGWTALVAKLLED